MPRGFPFSLQPLLESALLHHSLDLPQSAILLVHQCLLTLGVHRSQLLVERREAGEREGGITVRDGLEDGVVNERVLLFSLYHVVSLPSHSTDKVTHVDDTLFLQSVQAVVNSDHRARSTNTSTAVIKV